jgi:hypothetical protein
MVFNNSLEVKDRFLAQVLHMAAVIYYKAETIKHLLWGCKVAQSLGLGCATIPHIDPLQWKGVVFGDQWMIRKPGRGIWHTIRLVDIFFYQKYIDELLAMETLYQFTWKKLPSLNQI